LRVGDYLLFACCDFCRESAASGRLAVVGVAAFVPYPARVHGLLAALQTELVSGLPMVHQHLPRRAQCGCVRRIDLHELAGVLDFRSLWRWASVATLGTVPMRSRDDRVA